MRAWWDWYWQETGGNVLAMPVCGALAVAFAVLFRRPAAAWWHRHFGVRAELADVRQVADAAHRIVADLHKALTGEEHPDAPGGTR